MSAVCDICDQVIRTVTTDGKDNLTILMFHKLAKHQDEIIRDDPVIQQSKSSKQVRYWDKKLDKWVTATPMDDFSYDLGYAGLIKKDGMDE